MKYYVKGKRFHTFMLYFIRAIPIKKYIIMKVKGK